MLTAKQKAARSPYANWISDARLAYPYSSAAKAAEDITKRTNVRGLNASTMAAYESGARIPHAVHLEALESVFGPVPSEEAPTSSSDIGALVTRLDRQADVIDRLAGALEAATALNAQTLRLLDAAVRALAGGQLEPAEPIESAARQ